MNVKHKMNNLLAIWWRFSSIVVVDHIVVVVVVVVDHIVVVVVVLTLTRIIKSVVTRQALVTLEWRNTPGKITKPQVVHAYIIAERIVFCIWYFGSSQTEEGPRVSYHHIVSYCISYHTGVVCKSSVFVSKTPRELPKHEIHIHSQFSVEPARSRSRNR